MHFWTPENFIKAIEFIELIKGRMQNGSQYLLQVREQFWPHGLSQCTKVVEVRRVMAANLAVLLGAIGQEHLGALSTYRCDLDNFE